VYSHCARPTRYYCAVILPNRGLPAPGGGDAAGQTGTSSKYTYWPDYYLRPWTRIPPYIIGIGTALLWYSRFHKRNSSSSSSSSSVDGIGGKHDGVRCGLKPAVTAALTATWVLALGSTVCCMSDAHTAIIAIHVF
jgi:hypothetical protein